MYSHEDHTPYVVLLGHRVRGYEARQPGTGIRRWPTGTVGELSPLPELGCCNRFVVHEVLLLLSSNQVSRGEAAVALFQFLRSGPRKTMIACDDETDLRFLLELLPEWPVNVMKGRHDLRPLINTTVFHDAVCAFHDQNQQPWHHALHDARALRVGWLAWMDSQKALRQ